MAKVIVGRPQPRKLAKVPDGYISRALVARILRGPDDVPNYNPYKAADEEMLAHGKIVHVKGRSFVEAGAFSEWLRAQPRWEADKADEIVKAADREEGE